MSDFGILQIGELEAAFGWALIHFLWQGVMISAALAAVLELLRTRSSNARYWASCIALGLMGLLPLATAAVLLRPGTEEMAGAVQESAGRAGKESDSIAATPANGGNLSISDGSSMRNSPIWPNGRASAAALLFWALGVLFFSLRLLVAWFFTQRLRMRGTRPIDEERLRMLQELRRRLRVTKTVALMESALVTVPTAIGWLRPVILLPASALVGLSPAQLEAILAHELAHIRRYDYFINLLQTILETLLFYHPAVWWVSGRIRRERENCCDDLAVAVSGDPIAYARALLKMETLRTAAPQLAVAANGGDLMKRIHRLVGIETKSDRRFAGVLAVALAVTTIISAGVGATRLLPDLERGPKKLSLSAEQKETSLQEAGAVESLAEGLNDVSKVALSDRKKAAKKHAADAIELFQEASEEQQPSKIEPSFDSTSLGMSLPESLNALQSGDPTARAAAACRLGKLRAKEAIPALIDLLADDVSIKPVKCWGDGDWGPARAQLKGASPGEQAALALASLGRPAGEALVTALGHGDAVVRRNSAWAIGEMRGGHSNDRAAAIEPLVVLLNDADPWVRAAAAFSLGEIRPRGVTEPLIASLNDAEWFVRDMAIYALGEMKSQAALEPLRSLLMREENETVRRKAVWALKEIID